MGKGAARSPETIHFTIGSAAGHDSTGGLDLREDLALAKAALLYADHVKLCSAGSSVLSGIAEFAEATTEECARLVVRFLPDLQPSMPPATIAFFEAVVGMRGREEKRRVKKKTRKEILGMVKEQEAELEAMVLEQHQAAGIEGFREAVQSKRLEIYAFRQTSAEAIVEATIRGGGNLLHGVDHEADALFREKVKPEVERIEEDVKQNAGLAEFAWRTARHGATRATFGAVIGSAADLPTFAGAAAGALSGLGAAGVQAMLDRREKLKEIQGRQLFFYYRAGKMVQAKG